MNYLVRFWYGTDLRHEVPVTASTDVGALFKAFESIQMANWCETLEFRIEILAQ